MDELMTLEEVANTLRAPIETVRYWRAVGKGPVGFRVGRRVLYRRRDVEAFLWACQKASVGKSA